MNNDQQSNNPHGLPLHTSFNIGTTIQSVLRNINHAFASSHDSGGQGDSSRDPMDNMPPVEPLNVVGDTRLTDATSSRSGAPDLSISSASIPADADVPLSQLDSQRDDDEQSMPDLDSVSGSSDESDAGVTSANPVPPHQDTYPVDEDHDGAWTDDEGDASPVEPAIGTRRARVDDDGDDARDRRHPFERASGPPQGDAAPQNANPQQPLRTPAGLFSALFGLGPGGIRPGGDAPAEHPQPHTHTGEDPADPSSADNNATPGHAPRGAPILTAGFTFTIPLFGPPPANGNRLGPAPGGQGGIPGMMGMDAAAREELLASFAAFFQEFQALEEGREDPERAKKLLAGLDIVPLGLVKRLERVGGAPGGHAEDSTAEGSPSGCAICWDTLLDGESDNFSSLQPSGGEAPQPENRNETHTESDAMDVDASTSHSNVGPSTSVAPSSEEPKIISLPCAHVFHATCLVPWFTRARQATCPTCRFNIDPENLTYTPPTRRPFNRAPPAQPGSAANVAPADPQAAPQVPGGAPAADAAAPQVDHAPPTADTRPATDGVPPGPVPPPTGQANAGHGFNPFFGIPGIPVFSFPAIQIPLRPPGEQAPGDGNQGMDVLTIGLDMFVGVPPGPEERRDEPRDNAESDDAADNGEAGAGAAGRNGAANPNAFAQDLQSMIEGLLRTTRTFMPNNGQPAGPMPFPFPFPGPAPAAAADGVQPQPQPQARTNPVNGRQPAGPVPFPFPFPGPTPAPAADGTQPQARTIPVNNGQQARPMPFPFPFPFSGPAPAPAADGAQPQAQAQARTFPVNNGQPAGPMPFPFPFPFSGPPAADGAQPQSQARTIPVNGGQPPGSTFFPFPFPFSGPAPAPAADGAQPQAQAQARTFPVNNGQPAGPMPFPFPFPFSGPAPAPAADGAQARTVPEAAGRQPGAAPATGPRVFPIPLRPNMFRPTRPMPPRQERKTWSLPPAPGPSLRQRVEQREREQGLRCSDTSCGVGPSDEDPYPEPSVSSVKQASIRPLHSANGPVMASDASVCAHAFHPECLVSAERVAGWGGEKTGASVEVSCPVCRAVGCVTREEWESGVFAL